MTDGRCLQNGHVAVVRKHGDGFFEHRLLVRTMGGDFGCATEFPKLLGIGGRTRAVGRQPGVYFPNVFHAFGAVEQIGHVESPSARKIVMRQFSAERRRGSAVGDWVKGLTSRADQRNQGRPVDVQGLPLARVVNDVFSMFFEDTFPIRIGLK